MHIHTKVNIIFSHLKKATKWSQKPHAVDDFVLFDLRLAYSIAFLLRDELCLNFLVSYEIVPRQKIALALRQVLAANNKWSKQIHIMPRRHCTLTVQLYSPDCANVTPSSTPYRHLHRTSAAPCWVALSIFNAGHILGQTFFNLKIAPLHTGIWTRLICGSLGPLDSTSRTTSRSV